MSELNLSENATLRDAVWTIEKSRKTIAVVVNSSGRLLGTVSDGDIRRALLTGCDLEDNVKVALNTAPLVAERGTSESRWLALMQERGVEALPIIDRDGRFLEVVHYSELDGHKILGGGESLSGAVIMAGGRGRRLGDQTRSTPKPMIDVGGMPILERQVRTMVRLGVPKIFISVNYLGEMIEAHFGDGERFGAPISYLREEQALGTAGALSLLPKETSGPLLVVNGDILTGSDYGNLLLFHRENDPYLTVGVVEYRVNIPFGVLVTEGTWATDLVEKPSQQFLCNAGIYVLSPAAVRDVPAERQYNMTDVIQHSLAEMRAVSVFLIHEYWTDIGTPADLAAARQAIETLNGTL